MTSSRDKDNMKTGSAVLLQSVGGGEERLSRRPPPGDQQPPPPPANSNKPLTPFSIEDILNKPCVKKKSSAVVSGGLGVCCGPRVLDKALVSGGLGVCCAPRVRDKALGTGCGSSAAAAAARNGLSTPASPLCALEELASKTFKGLEVSVIQAAEGREHVNAFGQRQTSKKRRKSRTAFTNHQIYELEKRFLYQKYLSPADRDQIAQQLGLSNAQVITWFQNRRAKLKRDLEEMKADVESLKKIPVQALQKLVTMEDLDDTEDPQGGGSGGASPCSVSPSHRGGGGGGVYPDPDPGRSPGSSRDHTTDEFSEDEEDEEIEVDD